MKEIISTDKAPKAIGPYSQAIVANGFVFISGQIPLSPQNGDIIGDTIETQTRQVIENLKGVCESAGTGLEQIIKTTCFLKHMDDFIAFNEVYSEYFGDSLPARAAVEVSRLPKDVFIEIEAIAIK